MDGYDTIDEILAAAQKAKRYYNERIDRQPHGPFEGANVTNDFDCIFDQGATKNEYSEPVSPMSQPVKKKTVTSSGNNNNNNAENKFTPPMSAQGSNFTPPMSAQGNSTGTFPGRNAQSKFTPPMSSQGTFLGGNTQSMFVPSRNPQGNFSGTFTGNRK